MEHHLRISAMRTPEPSIDGKVRHFVRFASVAFSLAGVSRDTARANVIAAMRQAVLEEMPGDPALAERLDAVAHQTVDRTYDEMNELAANN